MKQTWFHHKRYFMATWYVVLIIGQFVLGACSKSGSSTPEQLAQTVVQALKKANTQLLNAQIVTFKDLSGTEKTRNTLATEEKKNMETAHAMIMSTFDAILRQGGEFGIVWKNITFHNATYTDTSATTGVETADISIQFFFSEKEYRVTMTGLKCQRGWLVGSLGMLQEYGTALQQETLLEMRKIAAGIGLYWVERNAIPVQHTQDVWPSGVLGSTYYKGAGVDAWGTPFQYWSDGKTYKLISYGQDQAKGGDGINADIILGGNEVKATILAPESLRAQ